MFFVASGYNISVLSKTRGHHNRKMVLEEAICLLVQGSLVNLSTVSINDETVKYFDMFKI